MSTASAPETATPKGGELNRDNPKTSAEAPKQAGSQLTPGERNLRCILEYVQANLDKIDCLLLAMQAKPGEYLLYEEDGRRSKCDYDFVSVDLRYVKEPQARKVGIHRTAAIEGMANRVHQNFVGLEPEHSQAVRDDVQMPDEVREKINQLLKQLSR